MQLWRFVVGGEEALSECFNSLWEATELDLDADDVHLAVLVTDESFVIAWLDDEGQPQAYYNDSWLCHAQYESENPHRMRFAAK